MWSAAASLAAPPWGALCCPCSLQWSLPSTQHGLQCWDKSRFPPAKGSSHPHWWLVCASSATAAHPWCQLSSHLLHIPAPISSSGSLEPSLHEAPSLVSAGCPGLLLFALSDVVLWLEELLCLPMEMVVLCHSNIHSSADASAPGDVVREEGRSGVESRCMAGAATALISSASPDSFSWEPLLGSTSPEGAFSSGCSGFGSCCKL